MGIGPYQVLTSAEQLERVANEISSTDVVGIDIETTGYDPRFPDSHSSVFRDDIRLLALNTGKSISVVDLYQTKTLGPIVPALAEQKAIKVIQNGKYEQKWFLQKYGLEIWPMFDTFRASALINNGRGLGNNLYDLYERELRLSPPTRDLGSSNWAGSLTPEQYEYSASDVVYLPQLRNSLKPKLAASGLNKIALIEFGSILPEAAVELNGFPIDAELWLALARENASKAAQISKELVWELPNPKLQLSLLGFAPNINLDSPQQMVASLRKLGLLQDCECRARNRGRTDSECEICEGEGQTPLRDTKEITLAMHAAEFPVIQKLLDYRMYSKRCSTYGPEYLEHIDPTTGRIHASFFPFTGAGRFSCNSPNLQQIPRLKEFRACFKPLPGKRFIIADYSGIEMRIVAELSGDPTLSGVFKRREDVHIATASIVTGHPQNKITKDERQQAKPVNFGFCIAEGQRVLTSSGLVPIELVQDWHLVWDGVEWVRHEGLMDRGIRDVILYDGLEATPDHEVYTDRGLVPFRVAANSGYCLTSGAGAGSEHRPARGDSRRCRVYDLYNAGPRHRFTVEGKVVSNCYGMQAQKFVLYAQSNYNVAVSLKQAEEFRRRYFRAYPKVAEWHRSQLRNVGKEGGFTRTLGGRIRYLQPDDYNEWLNSPAQGCGADGLKAALRNVYQRLRKYDGAQIVHHVHDEIVLEVPDDKELVEAVSAELSEGMIESMTQFLKHVPVEVETHSGYSWADK